VPVSGTIVVVGASLAGWRAATALRKGGHAGPIVVIGAEAHHPYDRPPLSKHFLTGRVDADQLGLEQAVDLDLTLRLGRKAISLDLDGGTVSLDDGSTVHFDGLVIATGAHPRTLPGLNPALAPAGVHVLRTVDDASNIKADLAGARRLVVVGAGFIGLEVASSAIAMDLDVTVLEIAPVPLERAVGPEIGALVAEWHREHGVDLRLGVGVAGVVGTDRVEGVRLAGSTGDQVLAADVVVIGVGVAPTTTWLDGSGLEVVDGVRADSRLRVLAGGRPVPNVVAAGDVVRWDNPSTGEPTRLEHWTNAAEQGQAAAQTLLWGDEAEEFAPVPYFWSDQFDRKIQMVGSYEAGDDLEIVDGSFEARRFAAAIGRAGRLVGAIGFSRPAKVMAMSRLIAEGAAFPPA
jgi:3-phenylpropionate/trans-cinnamate dioxygenase ferredoxin reductase component